MRHLDADLLLMVLAGQIPPRALLQVMYDHLKELCPECRTNLEMVAQELDWTLLEEARQDEAGPESGPAPGEEGVAGFTLPTCCSPGSLLVDEVDDEGLYVEAFRRAEAAATAGEDRILDERSKALGDLEELLRLAPDQRLERIARARTRFRSRWLAEMLIGECLEAVRRDPDEALHLADLVPAVLERIPGALGAPWGEELYARALAHRGNALRVRGEKAAADAAFFELHRFLAARSLESDDLHPELLSLEASLRDNQFRFTEARELVDRAVAAARDLGDTRELARYLVQRSGIRRNEGDQEGSRQDQRAALALLDPETDTHLYLCTTFGYAMSLCLSGEYQEAQAILDEHQDLARRHGEPWLDIQVEYHRGLIARGLGRTSEAEERFLAVRKSYAERHQPYDAAYISLELADLYLEQGRHRELAETAGWMARVFDTAGVDSEAMVAVALFQRAVAADEVTREMVGRLREKLEKLEAHPARKVHLPS